MRILTKSHVSRANKRNIVVFDPNAKGKFTKKLVENMLNVQLDNSRTKSPIVTLFVGHDAMNRIKTWRTFVFNGSNNHPTFLQDDHLSKNGVLLKHLEKINGCKFGWENLVIGMTDNGQLLLGAF